MNSADFISIDSVVSEVASIVDDMDFSKGLSKGWYISRGRDFLDEISFDTFYDEQTKDITINKETMNLKLPENCFNVRQMYLHNGNCNITSSPKVYWKRNFNNKNSGTGHTADIKEGYSNIGDPFLPSAQGMSRGYHNLYYANMQNGILMLSSSCSSYDKIRIIYNATFGSITDIPIIPRFFKRAAVDYIEERVYSVLKARNPRLYRAIWSDVFTKREQSMQKARMRASSMSTFEKESLNEYISNMIHK